VHISSIVVVGMSCFIAILVGCSWVATAPVAYSIRLFIFLIPGFACLVHAIDLDSVPDSARLSRNYFAVYFMIEMDCAGSYCFELQVIP